MEVWVWILIVLGVAVVTASVTAFWIYSKAVKKVQYMFDSFEDGEVNSHFKDKTRFNRTLNRLCSIYERRRIANEQESWSKLIRVLTHEIMNTLTPVVSLSDALISDVNGDGGDNKNIKEGLEIISDSSRNLMEFVSNYRRVTGIAKPMRKLINLSELIENVFKLNSQNLSSCRVDFKFPEISVTVYADHIQISQVIQNLIKNSIESGSTLIEVTLKHLSDGSDIIWFKNNGEPIPVELKDRIFIPFFTTKRSGSGIGLSVCRQIMRYHNGAIELLHSNPKETVFELQFN